MKKILITGHKGMIGSRLYNYLESLKLYKIKGIDLVDNSGDIRTFQKKEDFDIVIHCAALTSVTDSIKNPQAYQDTNFIGTGNLVNQLPNSKFIFLSTSAIYGEGLNHKEEEAGNPQSPYAQTKYDAEFHIQALVKDYVILRLANIYGGKKGEKNVYQIFEEENVLPIYGDGTSLRDYLHVDELVRVIHRSFDKQGIYNIGSGQTKTVLDIAKEFNKPIKYLPERAGEIKYISLDIAKAKKEGLCIKDS